MAHFNRLVSSFGDAVAVWRFSKSAEAGVTARGDVRLGVPLEGEERQSSIDRGGDGTVADLAGGYLRIGADRKIELTGKYMTFYMRVRNTGGNGNIPLFARDDASDANGVFLSRDQDGFCYLWRTRPAKEMVLPGVESSEKWTKWPEAVKKGVIPLVARLPEKEKTAWHDVIMRFDNAKLELFIDGVPMAEDWPYGELLNFTGPFLIGAGYRDQKTESGFTGQIDTVALWNRALRDDEVVRLSGGKENVAERKSILVPKIAFTGQYWHLEHAGAKVGDVMCAFFNNEFHFYDLVSERASHINNWSGPGSATWVWHQSSPDLVNWTIHPRAIEAKGEYAQWFDFFSTGNFVKKDSLVYCFIGEAAVRNWADVPDAARNPRVCRWVSKDGINFRAEGPGPVVGADLNMDMFVDVEVFRDPRTELHYLTYRGNDSGSNQSGVRLFRSKDLESWTRIETPFRPAVYTYGMCMSLFEWNGWYYMIGGDRRTDIPQKARSMEGPWEYMTDGGLRDGLSVPKVCEFTGNRRLLVGNSASWSGGVIVVRDLVQLPNGDLGLKFVPELIPQTGQPGGFSVAKLRGEVSQKDARVSLASTKSEELAIGYIEEMSMDLRITASIRPSAGIEAFGLCVRGKGDYESGAELRMQPGGGTVQFGTPAGGSLATSSATGVPRGFQWAQCNWGIGHVDVSGLNEPITLDVVLKNVTPGCTMLDVCINGRRTMITRIKPDGDRIFFFAKNGKVVFENLEIRPLAESAGVTTESTSNRPIKSKEKK